MNVDRTLLRELKPHPNNARTHSKKQIAQIAKSIEAFGFNNPVIIDDHKRIIAGHGRVQAAKLLGLNDVPTIGLSHLTEAQIRAYVLADNKLAEKAGWDRDILAIELQGLMELDFDLELIGFEASEVDVILDGAKEAAGEDVGPEDDAPAYRSKPIVTRPGDLWRLGQHRLLCADAQDETSYVTLLEDKAAFVFTDPPYNVPIDGHVCGLGRIRHDNFAMGCGEMSEAQFTGFLQAVLHHLAIHTLPGSIHMVCMDWRHMSEVLAAGRAVYTDLKNLCVWNKNNAGMGSFYRSKHELIFVWKNGNGSHTNNFELGQHGRYRTNVWDYPGISGSGRLDELAMHPTVKPVALVTDAIKDCSRRGELVLDAFAGSGTVLIAAERTGRNARALEIDPGYVDVAVRRWQEFTGKHAILESTGETFEDAEAHLARPKELVP